MINLIDVYSRDKMSFELLENEIRLLHLAIGGIAEEAGISFCYGCHNWGKSDEYSVIKCIACDEWECNECGNVGKITQCDLCLDVCDSCYLKLGKKYCILTMYNENYPLEWDNRDMFVDIKNTAENFIDEIDDAYSGSHLDYSLELIGIGKGPRGEILVAVSFNHNEDYEEDGVSIEELRDELISCLCEIDINPSLEELDIDRWDEINMSLK